MDAEEKTKDQELYDECNGSNKGDLKKVKDLLDQGADPNGYKSDVSKRYFDWYYSFVQLMS